MTHDQLQKAVEVTHHPKFNQSLSASGDADITLLTLEGHLCCSQSMAALSPSRLLHLESFLGQRAG